MPRKQPSGKGQVLSSSKCSRALKWDEGLKISIGFSNTEATGDLTESHVSKAVMPAACRLWWTEEEARGRKWCHWVWFLGRFLVGKGAARGAQEYVLEDLSSTSSCTGKSVTAKARYSWKEKGGVPATVPASTESWFPGDWYNLPMVTELYVHTVCKMYAWAVIVTIATIYWELIYAKLTALHKLFHVILTTAPWGRSYYLLQFQNNETNDKELMYPATGDPANTWWHQDSNPGLFYANSMLLTVKTGSHKQDCRSTGIRITWGLPKKGKSPGSIKDVLTPNLWT